MMNNGKSFLFPWRGYVREQISSDDVINNRLMKSRFYVIVLILLLVVNNALTQYYSLGYYPVDYIFFALHIFFFLSVVSAIFFLPYPPSSYGFNFNEPNKSIKLILIFICPFIFLSAGLRWMLVKNGYDQFSIYPTLMTKDLYKYVSYYPVSSLLQEAVTKGFFQSFFFALFSGQSYKRTLAIVLSSLVFAETHLVLGFSVFLGAFAFSVVLGYIYEQTRSLFAVTVLHYVTGISLFFMSNTQ